MKAEETDLERILRSLRLVHLEQDNPIRTGADYEFEELGAHGERAIEERIKVTVRVYGGYNGFFSDLGFDSEGRLLTVGAYE